MGCFSHCINALKLVMDLKEKRTEWGSTIASSFNRRTVLETSRIILINYPLNFIWATHKFFAAFILHFNVEAKTSQESVSVHGNAHKTPRPKCETFSIFSSLHQWSHESRSLFPQTQVRINNLEVNWHKEKWTLRRVQKWTGRDLLFSETSRI